MPEAIATPTRSPSRSPDAWAASRPESFQASMAATIANCEERSSRRALTRSRTSVGSTATRPAILTGISSAQSSVRARTPERPFTSASQVLATSPPTGLVVPRPVTTTLVRLISSSDLVCCGRAPGPRDGECRRPRGRALAAGQPWARSMKATASPTVLRFLTSSSGIETLNFSSAATTTSTMDSESTSRSSTNDLSSWTSSASMPATSLTMSARSARISSVVAIWGGSSRLVAGCVQWVVRLGCRSGDGDDLGGVRQPGAEGDEQGGVAAARLTLGHHPVQGQRDRGRRGVALVGDVAGDADPRGQLHGAGHGVDDAHVGLVGDEHVQLVDPDPGAVERLLADLRHREGRPAEDRVALHHQVRHHRLPGGDHVAPVLALADQVELLAVGAPDDRADAGGLAGTDDRGAGAVGEDERRPAVADVGEVGEPLHADDQDVPGAAGAHEVGGHGHAVAEARAGGGDVERGGLVGAELVGDGGGDGRGLQHVADRGDDHAVDLAGVDAGALEGLARGLDGHQLHGLLGGRPPPLLDAGALLDPLVTGVDRLDDVGVRDHTGRAVGADPEDGGVRRALGGLERAHELAPSESSG